MFKTLIASAAIAAAAVIFPAPANASPYNDPDTLVCDMIDNEGATATTFNQLARAARQANLDTSTFRAYMYEQLTLCPSFKDAYYTWLVG